MLLWCDRHCCSCEKPLGVRVEIAHHTPGNPDIDNGIPLCFDCHAAVEHYNERHPKGLKFRWDELKARRDQIYERYTMPLVPKVLCELTQSPFPVHVDRLKQWTGTERRELPSVGVHIANQGEVFPARAQLTVTLAQGQRVYGSPRSGHYDGRYRWNLNPGSRINGHFSLPFKYRPSVPLRARVDISLIDIFERSHTMLPVGFILAPGAPDWYAEPSEEALQIPKPRSARKERAA